MKWSLLGFASSNLRQGPPLLYRPTAALTSLVKHALPPPYIAMLRTANSTVVSGHKT